MHRKVHKDMLRLRLEVSRLGQRTRLLRATACDAKMEAGLSRKAWSRAVTDSDSPSVDLATSLEYSGHLHGFGQK